MATPCFSLGCSGTMTLVPNHDPRLTDPASRFKFECTAVADHVLEHEGSMPLDTSRSA